MPKYLKLTNEIIASWKENKHTLLHLNINMGKKFISFAYDKYFLRYALSLALETKEYKDKFKNSELKKISEILEFIENKNITHQQLKEKIKFILDNSQRGIWIFNIGTTNGFLYELLVSMLQFSNKDIPCYIMNLQNEKISALEEKENDRFSSLSYSQLLEEKEKLIENPLKKPDDALKAAENDFGVFIPGNNSGQ